MGVYRKDDAGNIKKVGGFLEKRFNPTWFECVRTIENGVEVYTVPEAAKDYYTLGFSKVYYFGIFESNTTDNPKLNFFGQMLAIRDLTQPDNNPAPGTLAGVYQMFTEAAASGETVPTEMALMTTVFAGNMIASVSAKALAAGTQPTVENKGTEYRAELEFGIPKGDTGAPGKDGKDGTSLDIQQEIYESPADLPAFADTTVNQAFVVKNTTDGYDMYFHAIDGTDWTIIPNWGGVQGPEGPEGKVGPEGPEGKPALQSLGVYTNGTPAVDAIFTISSTLFNRAAVVGDNTLVIWQANSKSWIVLAEVTAVASNVTLKVVNFVETTGLTGPAGPKGADGATGATGATGASYLIRKTSVITTNPGGGVSNDLASNFNRAPVVGDICFFTVATDSTTNPTNCWNCIGQITSISPVEYTTLMYQSTKGAQGPQGPQGNPAAVDSALSTTSENTVQNKVVTSALNTKLDKLPVEYHRAETFGSTNKVLKVGKFRCYDNEILVRLQSTTSTTYYAVLIIATQNYNVQEACVYGDAKNYFTPRIHIKPNGGSSSDPYVEVYCEMPDWSKNIVDVYQCVSDGAEDICLHVASVPSNATVIPSNAMYEGEKIFKSSIATDTLNGATKGNAIMRQAPNSGNVVLGSFGQRTTIVGNQDRPLYSKQDGDIENIAYRDLPLALLSDIPTPLEGLGIFRSSTSTSTGTTSISISSITVPSGRALKVGDLIIANSTYSYLYRVTAVGSSTVTVTYLQSLRGATGATGPAGSAGSNAPNFNLLTGNSWSVYSSGRGLTTTMARNVGGTASIKMVCSSSSIQARTPILNCSKAFNVMGSATIRVGVTVSSTYLPTGVKVEIMQGSSVVATHSSASSDYDSNVHITWLDFTQSLGAGTYTFRVSPTFFFGQNQTHYATISINAVKA